jgi:hypothetical protein
MCRAADLCTPAILCGGISFVCKTPVSRTAITALADWRYVARAGILLRFSHVRAE